MKNTSLNLLKKAQHKLEQSVKVGNEEGEVVRTRLGWKYKPFDIPKEIYSSWDASTKGKKNEDQKDIRFGLLKTWQFAHPRNKSITGPFKRFSKMITQTAYSILLNTLLI